MTHLWVGAAGIAGALLRYGLGMWIGTAAGDAAFPYGTLAVNLIGCFALGWLSRRVANGVRMSSRVYTAVSTGLIGSFTTYSTFGVEIVQLIRGELWGSALAYAGISMAGGLALAAFGMAVAGCGRGRRAGHD